MELDRARRGGGEPDHRGRHHRGERLDEHPRRGGWRDRGENAHRGAGRGHRHRQPATFTISAGASQQFTATARDANGNAVPGIKFLWVSSNANIAVVDTTGLARGVGRGDAIITATARGRPGNAVLSVAIPAGLLIVASTTDNAVYAYDPVTLTRLSTFSVTGPVSAAVAPDGRIYAGNNVGQMVAINPTTGDIAPFGAGTLIGNVYGTTVREGRSSRRDHRWPTWSEMNVAGASLGTLGSQGSTSLRATAFGPDGSFYLTSFSGGPVQRWLAGFVYEGRSGAAARARRSAIVTRASGEVVVTDQNQHAYFRFSREGVFLGSVNIDCAGQVRNVAVDPNDNLWVGCYGENAVVKFDTRDREVARLTVKTPSGVAFELP